METKDAGIDVWLPFITREVLTCGKSFVALANIQHQIFKKLTLRLITIFVRIWGPKRIFYYNDNNSNLFLCCLPNVFQLNHISKLQPLANKQIWVRTINLCIHKNDSITFVVFYKPLPTKNKATFDQNIFICLDL